MHWYINSAHASSEIVEELMCIEVTHFYLTYYRLTSAKKSINLLEENEIKLTLCLIHALLVHYSVEMGSVHVWMSNRRGFTLQCERESILRHNNLSVNSGFIKVTELDMILKRIHFLHHQILSLCFLSAAGVSALCFH